MKRIIYAMLLGLSLTLCSLQLSAHAQSGSVTEKQIKFEKGKDSAVVTDKANYAKSYVYTFGANKGQEVILTVKSKNNVVKFSLFEPGESEDSQLAFDSSEWRGKLLKSGKHQIVLVMNEEKLANVPYTLELSIK